jgi:adenine-specific DNA-methyltransferase
MRLQTVPFKKTLNKAYQKTKPTRPEIEVFKANLIALLDHIKHEESEEHVKNHLRDFLNNTWYKDRHMVNTKGRTDLVIHEDKTATSKAAVLFEVKRPKNTADMLTLAQGNSKALQELVLYYLQERIEHQNSDIKYLIITNVQEWYIFDASHFDRLFYQNKALRKEYEDWKNGRKARSGTDFFYEDIAKPFIADLDEEVPVAHFNIKDFEQPLRNADKADDKALIPLYKVFSPQHLLKQSFANDSNSLDKSFYTELLYLIGLEEVKDGGKKVIKRCAPERRQPGSLLENAINTLESTDRWRKVKQEGTIDEHLFQIGLELCITWMNRLLFLKLLEAQLVKYHGTRERMFLHTGLLRDFDEVNELFFDVLAKLPKDRSAVVQQKFEAIPYLNSSLFEISDLEADTLFISNLKDRFRIKPLSSTVLKDQQGKRLSDELPILDYLFRFLDAYDFASEGSEEIQEESKTLINASVLGLIFEKLNGYKDGSFFTPGFITMYMARETLRRAIVQKFNERYQIDCAHFDDVKNYSATRFKAADVLEMNAVVNSIRICDPAVGSGHFLVSALNEMLAIKSELGILADSTGVRLSGYEARVENDELIVACNDGQDLFEYRAGANGAFGKDMQRVQQTLFTEKQTIIERCLFGVDINPNSVKICRLRLWIELLKNTFYRDGTTHGQLETLPNIDINIKTGNSLISRFALDADLSKALKSLKFDINTYRGYVQDYQHATDKETKRGLLMLIDQIKGNFRSEIHRNDPLNQKKSKVAGQIINLGQVGLFGETAEEAKKRKAEIDKLSTELVKLEAQLKEIEGNKIYENAFEWRFEFPEVLDAEGKFTGFDVVIGNPPYIRQEELTPFKAHFQEHYRTFAGTADLYVYFVERGMQVLRQGGQFSYILPNKWMRAGYGDKLRRFVKEQRIMGIHDFGDLPVFEEATTYPCVFEMERSAPSANFKAVNIKTLDFDSNLSSYITENQFEVSLAGLQDNGWTLSNITVQNLLQKLRNGGTPLGDYVDGKIYRGILTGCNEAFFIDGVTRERLIAEDPRSVELIKPFLAGRDIKQYQTPKSDKFLIFTRRGIDVEQYPAILNHLELFRTQLTPKPKDFTGKDWPGRKEGTYKWYEIQDSVDYWEEFEPPKIVYQEIMTYQCFSYDTQSLFLNKTVFFLTRSKLSLLGLLNSKCTWFYLQCIAPKIQGGALTMQTPYVNSIPIPARFETYEPQFEALVTRILDAKRADPAADTSALEREIDVLVYGLYGLGAEDVAVVEEINYLN